LAIPAAAASLAPPPSLAFASSGSHDDNNGGGAVKISDNDDVYQKNYQSSDQTATIDSDNKIKGKDGSSITNAIGQSSEQNAANVLKDNDFFKFK
jgi:hypothetical protein